MSRVLLLCSVVLASRCSPVVYVPAPVPSAAGHRGVRLGAEGNVTFGQQALCLDASPAEAVSGFGRVVRASNGEGAPASRRFRHVGAEAGAVLQGRLGDDLAADLGVAVGRDRVRARGVTLDAGESVQADLRADVSRVGVHVGVFGLGRRGADEPFRVGPAVRFTRLVVRSLRREDTGADLGDASGFMAEPILRGRIASGRVDAEVQAGIVVQIQGDLRGRFEVSPLLLGARLGVRLFF